jgi:hypothetical protein
MKTDIDFVTEEDKKPADKSGSRATRETSKTPAPKTPAPKTPGAKTPGAKTSKPEAKQKQPRKSYKYSDIKSASISKKANLTTKDLDVMHKDIVKQSAFPSNITDIQNSAVKLGSNGPGKYYLKFTVKDARNGINKSHLPKLKLAIKRYIADYFNLSPSMVNKNLKDEDIIIFNKPKSKEFYTKFVISESVSSPITTDTLIDHVLNTRFDEADQVLSQIINNKMLTKLQSIIQK